MSVRVRALTCGWLTGPLGGFFEREKGRVRVPVPSFVVEHADGIALFDTGLHADTQHDPVGRLGDLSKFFDVHFEPGEEIGARLAALDIDPADVRFIVNSHLHFDHAGGNAQIPNAQLVVQRREWDAGRDDDLRAANSFDPRDYDLGHDRLLVDGEHDLFGDGRVVCIPTYGHTPGHQSLRVRGDDGEAVFTADACYMRKTLEALHLPAVRHDREAMLESLERLRRLRDAGARIVFGHDPEQWAEIESAPEALV